jgi:hypothetical protein
LGLVAVGTEWQKATFRKSVILALQMETARFSETLASTNQYKRRINPKEHNENRDSMFLRNVGACLQVYMALQPRSTTSFEPAAHCIQFFFLGNQLSKEQLAMKSKISSPSKSQHLIVP